MPITPSALKKRTVPATFAYGGEAVHIEYRPSALGGEAVAELNRLIREVEQAQAVTGEGAEDLQAAALLDFGRFVCGILAGWDYCEDGEDGEPGPVVPLTPERVAEETRRFGDFVLACIVAAVEDYRAGKPSGAASPAPSGATSSPKA